MKKNVICALVASAAFVTPHAAFAQDREPEVSVGGYAGLHDLGVFDGDVIVDDFDVTDNGAIFGGFVAVDFPVAESFFVGIEGNAAVGTDAIDAEYGASARAGFRTANGTKLYVRGGYQEVDVDAGEFLGVDEDLLEDDFDLDTTTGDYLVGAGIDVPLGGFDVRLNLDTIAFDTVRATAGIGLRF
ncbi:MAG: hypothetical protein QNI87_03165 [Erythrobacter sp.]|uniref:hypothetical protein n=1 Tax=Erythrobacter sp. TaxID=1042 RepID=UPI00260A03A2|nr:hypothetical protein [Erythrobacter sp.]MDJ0977511.1 hypothetical protein [Erythrobacter sp.]